MYQMTRDIEDLLVEGSPGEPSIRISRTGIRRKNKNLRAWRWNTPVFSGMVEEAASDETIQKGMLNVHMNFESVIRENALLRNCVLSQNNTIH